MESNILPPIKLDAVGFTLDIDIESGELHFLDTKTATVEFTKCVSDDSSSSESNGSFRSSTVGAKTHVFEESSTTAYLCAEIATNLHIGMFLV